MKSIILNFNSLYSHLSSTELEEKRKFYMLRGMTI